MPNFETAFKTVCELVKDFRENEHRYLSPQYQEAEVRRDFIDKLFEALGWDVYHRTQKNPYEQEVKVEKGVSVGKAQKRADYAFYISPEFRQPKFFCEAKKPCRSLKNADDYFQTIRYGWNANTPVAILTDFEEFHVLDCRYKPKLNKVLDNPNHKRYTYTDYANPEKFKEIYYLFSRDEVAKNSLGKYSESFTKGKAKGKTSFNSTIKAIDDDFLEYIDGIRETLAKAFKKNDSNLTSEELTEATQRTIDRIVFIRFLEDKLIEPDYYISEFGKKENPWSEFISVCRKLDAKYNGIVFKKHFIDEQKFTGPEQSTFKNICEDISHLNSPYDFNTIPIHILGSIYERFLGKVVNATAQRVRVEEKPEVRKAGGVYYTPKYIVDYIVNNTVGKLIENKSPKEISKLRFADIACGSGSFLIGIFETLLKYHNEYYQHHPEEAKKEGCINKDGQWILSIKQKQNILINNIYGVDIDNQAVEVTQLSLALKMLEDESLATANEMQVLFHEKILPDLSKNIVCGNSLIGTDIVYEETSEAGLFERKRRITVEEERKLNPMDFEKRFPQVFCHSREVPSGSSRDPEYKGGFDAIVGNPPYGAELYTFERDYLKNKYNIGNTDTAALFLLKSKSILKSQGYNGFIIPKAFTYASNWKKAREILLSDIFEIVDCSQVWNEVRLEMCIYLSIINYQIDTFNSLIRKNNQFVFVSKINKSLCEDFNFILNGVSNIEINIGLRIKANNISLNDYIINQRGCIYQNKIKENGDYFVLGGKQIHKYRIDKEAIKGMLNRDIIKDNKAFIKDKSILVQRIVAHIRKPKPRIIIIASIPDFDTENYVIVDTINQLENKSNLSSKFFLGILNSNLISWYAYRFIFANAIRTMQFDNPTTSKIPIPKINFQNETEKLSHDRIVSLVDQMLEAKKQLHNAKTERDKTYYENKCDDLDHAIDSEVYKLYGLTEDDIKIIEGKA